MARSKPLRRCEQTSVHRGPRARSGGTQSSAHRNRTAIPEDCRQLRKTHQKPPFRLPSGARLLFPKLRPRIWRNRRGQMRRPMRPRPMRPRSHRCRPWPEFLPNRRRFRARRSHHPARSVQRRTPPGRGRREPQTGRDERSSFKQLRSNSRCSQTPNARAANTERASCRYLLVMR